jgi:hypothetical protein
MRRFLIAVGCLAILPATVHGQGRGGGGMGHAGFSAPHASAAMHASPSAGTHFSTGSRSLGPGRLVRTRSGSVVFRPSPNRTAVARSASANGRPGRALLSQDIVPGLGFDYTHSAAVHPRGIRGRGRGGEFLGAYFPFYGGGYYLPIYPDDVDEGAAADAQQVDNGGGYETAQTVDPNRPPEPSQDFVPSARSASEQESEEYVFVRRDGTLFFATAYAWQDGTLSYITSEGLRRSVTADKLDLDATQQFNEQRGLTFHLPA